MGSPSMNFATVEPRGGQRLAVTFDGREVEIPDALARHPGLARYLGSRLIIGLRPAAFTVGIVTSVVSSFPSPNRHQHAPAAVPSRAFPFAAEATGDVDRGQPAICSARRAVQALVAVGLLPILLIITMDAGTSHTMDAG